MEEQELLQRIKRFFDLTEKAIFYVSIMVLAGTFGYVGLKTAGKLLSVAASGFIS